MKQVDVVIMGQNYSTSLGLIQAVGEAGFSVGAVHYSAYKPKKIPFEFKSRYVIKYLVADRNNEHELVESMIKHFSNNSHKTILLPSDDYAVAFIDRNIAKLEMYFIVPNGRKESGEMTRFMDKRLQSKMAVEAGLLTARCWKILLNENRNIEIPDNIIYPCITKPQRSIGSPKSYIQCCNDKNALLKELELIKRENPCPILVEEFIDIETEYTVPVLAFDKEVYIPVFLQKTQIGSGRHKGVTISGRVVSSSHFSVLVEGMKRLIINMGLQGVFDIEILKQGDKYFFNELNLRYGAAGYALTRAGINMPALWIDYCHGKRPDISLLFFNEGMTFVSDKAAVEDYWAGHMSWKEYMTTIKSADFRFLVNNPDTPIRRGFRKIEMKAVLSRFVRRLFR